MYSVYVHVQHYAVICSLTTSIVSGPLSSLSLSSPSPDVDPFFCFDLDFLAATDNTAIATLGDREYTPQHYNHTHTQ